MIFFLLNILQAQVILMVALLLAIVNFLIGTFIPPSKEKMDRGIVGYTGKTLQRWKFSSDQQISPLFFSIFCRSLEALTLEGGVGRN